ncbi:hypothetical protein HRbin27_00984 [bacterium HR27]|nr:hypothetical protein HRbin27_00984 [bacterium HR27]
MQDHTSSDESTTERVIKTLDQRDGPTLPVDHAQRDRVAVPVRRRGDRRTLRIDPCAQGSRIPLVEQPLDRHRDEGGITEIAITVGKGQLLGFEKAVQEIRRSPAEFCDRKAFHDIEQLESSHTLRIRRQFHDLDATIRRPERLDPVRPMRHQIIDGHGAAVRLDDCCDFLGDRATVEGLRATLGDEAERLRQRGLAQDGTRLGWPTLGEKLGNGCRLAAEHLLLLRDRCRELPTHRKATLGIADRWLQELVERPRATALEHGHPGIDRTRHRHTPGSLRWN